MVNLRKDLPPLTALVTFESAARLSGFTRAAEELGVSQAAVSRQIQHLEAHLDVVLFRRLHRAVQLTPAGARLLSAVQYGLGSIVETARELKQGGRKREITVHTTIAFASFWLMPRLERFRLRHPGIELRLVAGDMAPDLAAEGIQLGVRYGSGRWPNLDAQRLFDDEIFPVCSPAYITGPLARIEDLHEESLVQLVSADPSWISWEKWFALNGVSRRRPISGPSFNSYTLAIQAAQGGQGIALGWRRLVAPLLQTGALIRPIHETLNPPKEAYYLVLPEGQDVLPETAALGEWLREEAAESD